MVCSQMSPPSLRIATLALTLGALSACGSGSGSPASDTTAATPLTVSVQNSTLLPGVDRLGVALLTPANQPVLGAAVRVTVLDAAQHAVEAVPLQFIGSNYGQIPVYLGAAAFPAAGRYHLTIAATLSDGSHRSGAADVDVTTVSSSLPVGHSVTEVKVRTQRVSRDVNGDLGQIDSGIKDGKSDPDPFHDDTIQDGLTMHKPMVLYFGEPGRCVSQTCGPTVQVLEQIYPQYKDRMLFEHIEVHDPALGEAFNPVIVGFGLTTEPWVYFINDKGVVADRFEGPVTVEQLRSAADGTLAGRVPAVDITAG
jgi:hypothetical protein